MPGKIIKVEKMSIERATNRTGYIKCVSKCLCHAMEHVSATNTTVG